MSSPRARDRLAPLRVLVVPKWYPWPEDPVLGVFCREQARALAGGHEVVVLASRAVRRPPFRVFARTETTEDDLRTIRVQYRRPRFRPAAMLCQLAGMMSALWRLRREGWRPDVVHAHVYSAGLPGLLLARASGARLVITEHYTGFERGLIRGYDRITATLAFRGADLVAAVSRPLAEQVRALAPRVRIEVVPNVVDTAVFHPAAGSADRDDGALRLLNVAALAAKKGQADLLSALALLRAGAAPEAVLTIAGGGELREALEARARELGLGDAVRFLGPVPKSRVADLMREADLFVLPSHYENLPCVLLESMASGLPAVATDVGGVAELIDPGTGVLCPPRQPEALASAVLTAAQAAYDPSALAARAARVYGYAPFRERWTALYAELLSSAGNTRSATRRRTASGR